MAGTDITRRDHAKSFEKVTTESHVLHLQPFRAYILEVEDEHFHHNSAVLLPNYPATEPTPGEQAAEPSLGLAVLAECLKHARDNPKQKALIVGHADTSGPDPYNIGISIKRAKAVLHAILGEREAWVKISHEQHKTEDYQLILKWVAKMYGWDCDPGPVDNHHGSRTTTAVKNFQSRYNQEFDADIPVDGTVGKKTWGAIFDVYMDMVQNLVETDEAGLAQMRAKLTFLGPKLEGCGENWPIEEPKRKNYRSRINRRVEILFFDPGEEPKLDCHPGGTACTPVLCELYNPKMYRFTHLPVPPSVPKPLRVFLKLTYLDPEKNEKPFPPDFPVTVVWNDGSTHTEKTKQDGALQFGVPREQGSFAIQFDTGDTYVATAADGSSDKTAHKADLKELHKNNFRFFKVPEAWTLKQSDWTPDAAPHYDATNFRFTLPLGRFGRTLGTGAAPERLKLDPHWHFVRFEFFDRYFGHSDHNHKRVNIPATLIDGWRTNPPAAAQDTRSHWTIRDADPEKAVHAVPWIIQFKPDRTAEPKMDKDVQLGFETEAGTFVISESATSRKIDVVTGWNMLGPSVDRLKLYDLPKKWKSQKYYTRFSDGNGEFFDKANTFEDKIKASNSPDTPLIFSLDDIVLTDQNKQQVTLTANDKVAIFFHRFVKAAEAGKTSDLGIYKFDDGHTASYQTDLDMTGKFYIFDYPNWTRLIIAQQNLWDVFADRTEEGGSNQVIGARAAVRWVDATSGAPLVPAPAAHPVRVPNMVSGERSGFDFICIQPYFEQRFGRNASKYTGPGTAQQGTGRYDMARLRCCDHEGDVEVIYVIHYMRLLFNFLPGATAAQAAFMDNFCTNVAARWNGNETGASAHNTHRAELLPQRNEDKIKGYVLWFLQPVPAALPNVRQRAHFLTNVYPVPPGAMPRAFMASDAGYGEFADVCDHPENQYSLGSYTGAHEVGHGNSLPDEYSERWTGASWGELSFWCRTPGDPYEPDGRFDPNPGAALTQQDSGMMNGVVKMRNRYFWHSAEFARVSTGTAFKVKYDTYDDYKVPPHSGTPAQAYVYWPSSDAVDSGHGARGKSDLLTYTLGKDRYACAILPHATDAAPFDGVLVVMVKMQVTLPSFPAASISQILAALRGIVGATLNNKFMATGTIQAGTAREWEFKKCQVRFSPRFAVTNVDASDAQYATHLGWMQAIGAHFVVQANHSTTPNTHWNSASGNQLTLEVDFTRPTWLALLQSQFRDRFAEMVGFANAAAITKASLKPVVQKVIPAGDVADIT